MKTKIARILELLEKINYRFFGGMLLLLTSWTVHAQTPSLCVNPSPSQAKTLQALAFAVEDVFSIQTCDQLYQKLHALSELNLENRQLEDLTPLRELIRLEKLILDDNRVHDLNPLSELKHLKKLFLVNNRIVDISPLAPLKKLEYLYLSYNRIESISTLRRLPALRYLYLNHNNITSLYPLRHSYKLSWLIADHNRINHVSDLRRLKYIKKIDLLENPLTAAGSIAHFPNFKRFRLPKGISLQPTRRSTRTARQKFIPPDQIDLKAIKTTGPARKQTVAKQPTKAQSQPPQSTATPEAPRPVVQQTKRVPPNPQPESKEQPARDKLLIAKLAPIEPPKPPVKVPGYYVGSTYPLLCKHPTPNQEKTLKILANKVDTVYAPDNCVELFKRLNKLIMLIIQGKGLEDITPLESLTNLTWLFLYNNRISDVSPLRHMTRLRSLGLNHNRIVYLAPLKGLENLSTLSLHNNRIKDIKPLINLKNLTSLSLHNNKISDISPLKHLVKLSTLKLNHNAISDLNPLQSLIQLSELHLKQNRIVNIAPLKDLTGLKKLDLRLNRIKDFTPVKHMTNYHHFSLKDRQAK